MHINGRVKLKFMNLLITLGSEQPSTVCSMKACPPSVSSTVVYPTHKSPRVRHATIKFGTTKVESWLLLLESL